MGKNRCDTEEELYIDAYKMMAFFEEAVDTLEVNKYNLQRVQLNRVNKKSFYFMVPVNIFINFFFHFKAKP